MLKQLLDKQIEYTTHYFDSLNLQQTEKFVDILLNSSGMIFFTGVGKSGLVAKKIAFTMVSTGTRAFYVSPTDAVHGDLGMVSQNDVFVILSKSGESDELLNLIPAIRNKGATLLGVVCNPQSRLAAACHYSIVLPCARELCPFDMAPTTSTTAQLMFGDLLTIAIMQHKKFSINEYALNHPSGRIGKRITLKVKDLMLTGSRLPLCYPNDKVTDVLVELSNKRAGCLLIIDMEGKLEGIFMDGDLRRSLQKLGGAALNMPIKDLMTKDPRWVGPEVLAWDALKAMEADPIKRITALPVIDQEHRLLGLLHLHDIIQSGL